MTLYVFKIDDGATHHVIANHPGEAVDVLAKSNGQTRVTYCEEFPDHEVKRLEPHERVTIRLDLVLGTGGLSGVVDLEHVPVDAVLTVSATATCAEWIAVDPSPRVLCSTEV